MKLEGGFSYKKRRKGHRGSLRFDGLIIKILLGEKRLSSTSDAV